MIFFLLSIPLLISVFLEAFYLRIPLVFNIIIIFYILKRPARHALQGIAGGEDIVFILSLIFGIILDIFYLRQIGATSLFLIFSLFFIKIYERKFEVYTKYFVVFFSMIGSFIYLFIFNNENILLKTFLNAFICLVIFVVFEKFLSVQKHSQVLRNS